eukprot:12409457-Karenia_brevis.AAC.1
MVARRTTHHTIIFGGMICLDTDHASPVLLLQSGHASPVLFDAIAEVTDNDEDNDDHCHRHCRHFHHDL